MSCVESDTIFVIDIARVYVQPYRTFELYITKCEVPTRSHSHETRQRAPHKSHTAVSHEPAPPIG